MALPTSTFAQTQYEQDAGNSYIHANNKTYTITPSDKQLLTHLVYAEETNEPYAGHVAVATVVLNRMVSGEFPDTVPGVINQVDSGHYQFTPVLDGRIKLDPDWQSYKAVDEALSFNYPTVNDSLFFYNPKIATSRWLDSLPTTVIIGNTVFKR